MISSGNMPDYLQERAGDPESTLSSMTTVEKRIKGLHFGITLYENELIPPISKNPRDRSPEEWSPDYVHLSPDLPVDAGNYSKSYAAQSYEYFPECENYWRRVCLRPHQLHSPCAPASFGLVTPTQELNLFQQTLQIQLRLLKNGELDFGWNFSLGL